MKNTEIATKNITIVDLQVRLSTLKSACLAQIVTITEVAMNKGGNPFYGRVTKKSTSNVVLNFIYSLIRVLALFSNFDKPLNKVPCP